MESKLLKTRSYRVCIEFTLSLNNAKFRLSLDYLPFLRLDSFAYLLILQHFLDFHTEIEHNGCRPFHNIPFGKNSGKVSLFSQK